MIEKFNLIIWIKKKVIKFISDKATLLFILLAISLFVNACNKPTYTPKKGDVYIVSLDDHTVTTWKITQVENASIWYIINDYNVSEKYLADSINLEENYTDTPKSISKKVFNKKNNLFLIETPKK
jgi:hypothetical protein